MQSGRLAEFARAGWMTPPPCTNPTYRCRDARAQFRSVCSRRTSAWRPRRGTQLANDRANADNARPLMPDARIRAPWIAAALAAGDPGPAAGCGRQREGRPGAWEGALHAALRRLPHPENAGTKGVQGPNLDLAFKQSVADGLGRSTIEGVVRKQIALPQGGQMPAEPGRGQGRRRGRGLRGERDRQEGRRRRGRRARPAPRRRTRRTPSQIPTDPNGQLAYQFKSAEAKAGKVTIESKNDSSVPHDIALKGGPRGRRSSRAARPRRSRRT